MKFRNTIPCAYSAIKNTSLSGILPILSPTPLPRIFGRQAVFKHNSNSPYPHHTVTKPFANIFTVRNLSFSKLMKTRKNQGTFPVNPNLQPSLKSTKRNWNRHRKNSMTLGLWNGLTNNRLFFWFHQAPLIAVSYRGFFPRPRVDSASSLHIWNSLIASGLESSWKLFP